MPMPMIVFMVAGVTMVHENMHQRAQQQNQVRQSGQEVRLMLCPKKIAACRNKCQKSQVRP